MARNPRMPSVVFRVCKPKPAGRIHVDLIGAVNSRTDSPSVHHRLASIEAYGFFPASALLPHEALRPPGAEDARCVQPTSATQTICVHPHLVRSRLPLATFAAWTPRRVLGSTRYDRGTEWFTPSGPLWRIVPHTTETLFAFSSLPRAFCLTALGHERGRFLPTARRPIEPLTSLSPLPRSPRRARHLRACAPYAVLLGDHTKCRDGRAAKTMFRTEP
jgi:hypothetical protein